MKSYEQLFYLVQSLSKNERRYFRRYSTMFGNDDKDYLKLFDILAAEEHYNEGAVKQSFEESYAGNFGMLKKHLTEQLLKSLSLYHAESTEEHKILGVVREIKILQKRGFYEMAASKVNKAIKRCKATERYGFLPILYSHKKSLVYQNYYNQYALVDLEKVVQEELESLKKMSEVISYVNLLFRFFYTYNHPTQVSPSAKSKAYQNILRNTLIADNTNATTFTANSIRYHILATYNEEIGKYQIALELITEHIDLYERFPEIKKEFYLNLVNILYGQAKLFIKTQQQPKAMLVLKRLETELANAASFSNVFFVAHNTLLAEYYNSLGEYDKVVGLWGRLENNPAIISGALNTATAQLILCLAYGCLKASAHNQAIGLLKMIIDAQKPEPVSFAISRFLLMMAHLEMGNFDIVRHLAVLTKNALQAAFAARSVYPELIVTNFLIGQFSPHHMKSGFNGFSHLALQELQEQLKEVKKAERVFSANTNPFEWGAFPGTGWPLKQLKRLPEKLK